MSLGHRAVAFAIALVVLISIDPNTTWALRATPAVCSYFAVRWALASVGRTRYQVSNRGHQQRTCGNCDNYVRRLSGDWVLTCRRCGWRPGWPLLRWVTQSVPARQFRRTVSVKPLIVGVVIVAVAFPMVVSYLPASGLAGDDFDGDNIPNAAENESEVNGASLPDADSQQKDLYVTLLYSNDSERLTETEKQQLQSIWGSMNVSNPTGEPGIDLHIVEEQRAQKQFEKEWSGDYNEKSGITNVYEETIDEGCGVYHLVIMGDIPNSEEANVNGWGDGPGYATYVNHERQSYDSTEYGSRVRTITHELLHNIVGEIDGEHATGDPLHSREGWLSHTDQASELSENEALDPAVAKQLSTDGFKDSELYRSEVC